MKPLRILLVMVEPPLPFGNAAARGYYALLKGLVERGHLVTAFAACSAADVDAAAHVFPSPAYDLRCFGLPHRHGLGAKLETWRRPYSYMFGADLQASLEAEAARGFDVLHLEQLWSGWTGLRWSHQAVLNVHYLSDIDLRGPGAWRSARARWLAQRASRHLLRRFPTITTLTPRLSAAVRRIAPSAQVTTVPLGLDTALYPFAPRRECRDRPVVSLIGSFTWLPTYAAGVRLLRLWPEIVRRVPSATLQIVGRGARVLLARGADGPGIAVHEDVPDARPFFDASDVLLYAATRASGMKVKVLEAFALGVPVVTTHEGVEGLPARDGIEAGVADDDRGLVDRAVALLTDGAHAERQRVAARALVESHCRPGAIVDAFENVYRRLDGGAVATVVPRRTLGLVR